MIFSPILMLINALLTNKSIKFSQFYNLLTKKLLNHYPLNSNKSHYAMCVKKISAKVSIKRQLFARSIEKWANSIKHRLTLIFKSFLLTVFRITPQLGTICIYLILIDDDYARTHTQSISLWTTYVLCIIYTLL